MWKKISQLLMNGNASRDLRIDVPSPSTSHCKVPVALLVLHSALPWKHRAPRRIRRWLAPRSQPERVAWRESETAVRLARLCE